MTLQETYIVGKMLLTLLTARLHSKRLLALEARLAWYRKRELESLLYFFQVHSFIIIYLLLLKTYVSLSTK